MITLHCGFKILLFTLLMIVCDSNLKEKCPDQSLVHVLQRYLHPSRWLLQVHHLNLLEVIEVGADPDADPGGGVALVQLEVCVDCHRLDRCLASELNIDKVRQLAIALPVGVSAAIPQTLDTVAWLAAG